ncbi:ABC-2 type transport system ATP-binding protein [Streptomyces sp. LBL]|uniref:ABC transporter ATP-binding protein n=1 Tax=Streptomyces sp. LBL TaxID=2940562 RepID=UPI00247493A1|nr:ABC transporter ATP-binding protein [Streptomyces sp. LBL]MDH6623232.1 ABC-2 type transport system ATP-binding protein [Streptomyces sp. LBL]
MTAVEVVDLGRDFVSSGRRITALDGVNLTVAEGEIVALLGENGAGKTTLTKILATLLLPSRGTARIFGVDVTERPQEVRRHQSVVFGGERGFYHRLSARDNLRFFALLDGASPRGLRQLVDRSLERAGLADAAGRAVETYSRGMRQRLHLAVGFATRPRLMLLDEPTIGLDPVEAARLRAEISALRDQGVTILLTSHHLLDVEELAERVVALHGGRVVEDLLLADFTRRAGFAAVITVTGHGPRPVPRAGHGIRVRGEGAAGSAGEEPGADTWTIVIEIEEWGTGALGGIGALLDGCEVTGFDVTPARLEDSFRRLYESPRR